jgi:hypothetical protein
MVAGLSVQRGLDTLACCLHDVHCESPEIVKLSNGWNWGTVRSGPQPAFPSHMRVYSRPIVAEIYSNPSDDRPWTDLMTNEPRRNPTET